MILENISLKNYRNIEFAEIAADKNMNIICGDNAQGKTNLIEAIWLLTGTKSFRGAKENEIIKFSSEKAIINAKVFSHGLESEIKIEIGEKKTFFVNGKKANGTDLLEKFNAIVFSPNDISLVYGEPSFRRKFLDVSICQIYPKYAQYLKNYARALTQRASILKESKNDASLKFFLDDFENELVKNGEKIIEYRRRYLKKLLFYAPDIYHDLSGKKEKIDIEYLCSVKSDFLSELKANRKEDILKGATSVGPHRDDMVFLINGKRAKEFSSQGQKRSIALTLKLASAQILKEITGEQPVALLDDVMSELDKTRQDYILNHISNWQVFLTCCEKAHFENLAKGKIFSVKNGEIT
ncbi:MAG: DNA replication/repair protein RecF [Clostridiales bacterium]|nr:DNA replication/repair protein RecF [Candidatus Equinaster intestinalis]